MLIKKDIATARDPLLRGSLTAMARAAALARKVAIQTDTAIIVVQEGRIVRVTAEELRRESGRTRAQP